MSDFIPEELMVNIWMSLPVRSAVRFRCVSKSWRASLSDPDLISKNLTTFSDPNQQHDDDLIVLLKSNRYCTVSHETLQVSPIRVDPWVSGDVIVLFSTGGLICIYKHITKHVMLWNPATKQSRRAPPPPRVDGDFAVLQTIGFGLDAKNNDYKIVRILSVWKDDNMRVEAFVHSLRSDYWRKLEEPDIPVSLDRTRSSPFPGPQAYKDGTFYWLADGCSIVSFDMSDEVFKSITIPKDPSLCIDSFFWLKDGGSLGVSTYMSEELGGEKSVFQIWALLDVRVAQSWTRLLTIDDSWVTGLYRCLGFWRNEFLFQTYTKNLILCDPFKQETKAITTERLCFYQQGWAIPYMASRYHLANSRSDL